MNAPEFFLGVLVGVVLAAWGICLALGVFSAVPLLVIA